MKKQVVYIHGGESFANHADYLERLKTMDLWHLESVASDVPFKKWTGTFSEDLGDAYEVIMPPMPNKQNAKFSEWSIWFERHFVHLSGEVTLIGCSLGAMFLAKYLSQNNIPFRPVAVILMAGAYRLPGFDDKDCGDFLIEPEKVSVLSEKTDELIIMHSKDDFLVPYAHAEALYQAIPQATLMSFEDKNHFLIPEFPELTKKIKEITNNKTLLA